MRASTAFFVGVGTVGLAIVGGLGGGLVIGNMMSPSPPKRAAEAAQLRRPTPPQPMPASAPLPYMGAALAFTDRSIDGSSPPSADRQADSSSTPSPQVSVAATGPRDQATRPADSAAARQPTQEAQQAPSAKQMSKPEDAYAKARDSDLKHEADKRRAERAQRWADRRRRDQDQNQNQQARDDRSNGPSDYSYNNSDRRYRDERAGRYRDAERDDSDDRAPPYYAEQAPRLAFPRIQLFGPDN